MLPLSPDVDMRAAVPIGLSPAYHLAGDGCDLPYTEDQEAEQVRRGLPSVHSK